MEQIINQIKQAIAAAVQTINKQKETIASLRTQLASVSQEYTAFQQAEAEEDAATDSMLKQLCCCC